MKDWISVIGVWVIAVCLIVGLVLGWNISNETGFYDAAAVVKATGPGDAIRLKNDGTAKTIDLTLKETAGKGAMITDVSWALYDATGVLLTSGSESWMPPKEVAAGGKTTVSIDIDYRGTKTGPYTLKYTASGDDAQRGGPINSIAGYSSVDITS